MSIYTPTKLKSHAQLPPPPKGNTLGRDGWQLGARDVFAEDPSSIPSTHV